MAESHDGVTAIATIPSSLEETFRRTMVLGLPPNDADKPTFYFARQVTWADHDVEDQPWDWTAAPSTDSTPAPVTPICAYEFFSPLGRSGAEYSEVGDWFPSTVRFTFTETDFQKVVDSSYVIIGPRQTKWWFRYFMPAIGLGGLTIYQAHFQAENTE